VKAVYGPKKDGEQFRSAIDCAKLMRTCDWSPRVNLNDGLAKTVEYFRGI